MLAFDTEMAKKLAPKLQQAAQQRLDQMRTKDVETLKADKEYGGVNYDATLKAAQSATAQFFGEEGSKVLKATGLDNHPAIVKGLARLRKAISEDSTKPPLINPAPNGPPKPTSQTQRGAGLYSDPKVRVNAKK